MTCSGGCARCTPPKNFRGSRIVALGGALGKYVPDAPQVARERYELDIVEVTYEEFDPANQAAR